MATASDFCPFDALCSVCDSVTENITKLEQNLESLHESETKIPNVEPTDPEKKELKEKLSALELQETTMKERYNTLKKQIHNIQSADVKKIRPKITYYGKQGDLFVQAMQPVNFEELTENVLTVREPPKQPVNMFSEEVIELLKQANFPENATLEEKIEFLRTKIAITLVEKKNLLAMMDKQQLKQEVTEQLYMSDKSSETTDSSTPRSEKKKGSKKFSRIKKREK